MNKIPLTLLKFTKPINSEILQYKSIIFPDSNPYRIICHIDEYSNTNDDIHQIYSCVLTTIIYPFFERQYQLFKKISMEEYEKMSLLRDINSFANEHRLIYRDIDIYQDPNGFTHFSTFNHLLKRRYISKYVKDL